jgi:hypothetical protein
MARTRNATVVSLVIVMSSACVSLTGKSGQNAP